MDQNCKGSLPVVQRVNVISTTSKYEVPDKWGQTIIQLSEIGTCVLITFYVSDLHV